MARDDVTMELGMRWRKNRRQMKAAAKKAGMEWQDFLAVVDRVGLPGKENQDEWIAAAKGVTAKPRAIDWQALIEALMPLIEKLLAMCMTA